MATTYRTIGIDLERRIRSGEWGPEEYLPARATLAHEYGVALETLQRAVRDLLTRGILIAHHRRGTRVATPTIPTIGPGISSSAVPQGVDVSVIVAATFTGSVSLEDNKISWVPPFCRACEEEADRRGIGLNFSFFNFEQAQVTGPAQVAAALEQPCAGRILVDLYDNATFREALIAHSPPLRPSVWVGGALLPFPVAQVYPDHRQAGYLAARALLDAGYTRLAALPVFQAEWSSERFRGVADAAAQAGVPLDVWPAPESAPWGQEQALGHEQLLKLATKLGGAGSLYGCGIIVGNDVVGIGVLTALAELGVRPGAEVGVIGFDDYLPSRSLGLSTMRPPLEDMGRTAVRLLSELFADGADPALRRVSPRHDVVRRSSTRFLPRSSDTATLCATATATTSAGAEP